MGKRKINTELSEKSAEYFDKVKDELEGENKPGDVVNYVFETLADLEKIIGDPAEFIEAVLSKKTMIVPVLEKPFITPDHSDDQDNYDTNKMRIGNVINQQFKNG